MERLIGGRYRLTAPIGRGGMGTVWRAHDEFLDRTVAIKELVLPPELTDDERSVVIRRTMREARAAGRLSHPGVVVVHDVIEEDRRPWIVMQEVVSRSLGQVVREDGPLPPDQVAEIGIQVLGALQAAHRSGVLHRDVKPENVLLAEDGRVVLTDFGIAVIEEDASLTRTGTLLGTPSYIPPERITGEPATPESDLWSLGATLYTAVEGRPAYDRGGTLPTVAAVLNEDPDPAEHAGPLEPIIFGLLQKHPADRLTADETATRLATVAGGRPHGVVTGDHLSPRPSAPKRTEFDVPEFTDYADVLAADDPKAEPGADSDAHDKVDSGLDPGVARRAGPARLRTAEDGPANVGAGGAPGEDAPAKDAPGEDVPAGPSPADVTRLQVTERVLDRLRDLRRGATSRLPDTAADSDETDGSKQAAGPSPAAPEPRTSRSWLPTPRQIGKWALFVLPIAIIIALIAAWLGAQSADREQGTRTPGGAGTKKSSPKGAAPAPATPPGSMTPTAFTSAALPPGWRLHDDRTGFKVAVPAEWNVSREGSRVHFRKSSRHLLIDHTSSPRPDPLADWKSQEGRSRGSFPGYKRKRMEKVDYMDKAADWEWTYNGRSGKMRVVNRGFTIGKKHGYAIYWETLDKDWDKDLEDYFGRFTDTFKPAS